MRPSPDQTLAAIERDLFANQGVTRGADWGDLDTLQAQDILPSVGVDTVGIPAHLLDMIERRVLANRVYVNEPAAVGQIRRVTAVPEAGSHARQLHRNCAVLLGRNITRNCWAGWMVTQESAWASEHDLVLQHEDGVFSPDAAMVQTWNPLELVLTGDEVLIGQLGAERLGAVLKLAEHSGRDFTPTRFARIGVWDLDQGTSVVTGTPLAGDSDPRVRYQDLYRTLADQLTAAALRARTDDVRTSIPVKGRWESWLRTTFVKPAWTCALAGLALVQALMLVDGHDADQLSEAIYRSELPTVPVSCRALIRIRFKVDTPYADFVVALRRVDARLVSGPSAGGDVWISSPVDQNPHETAAMLQASNQVEQADVVPMKGPECTP